MRGSGASNGMESWPHLGTCRRYLETTPNVRFAVSSVAPHNLTIDTLILASTIIHNSSMASTTNPADPLGLSEQVRGRQAMAVLRSGRV